MANKSTNIRNRIQYVGKMSVFNMLLRADLVGRQIQLLASVTCFTNHNWNVILAVTLSPRYCENWFQEEHDPVYWLLLWRKRS